jgi:hypothetical protein
VPRAVDADMIVMHGDGALDHRATRQAYVLLASDFKTAGATRQARGSILAKIPRCHSQCRALLVQESEAAAGQPQRAGGEAQRRLRAAGSVPSEREKKTIPGRDTRSVFARPLSRRPHARHSQSVRPVGLLMVKKNPNHSYSYLNIMTLISISHSPKNIRRKLNPTHLITLLIPNQPITGWKPMENSWT